MQNPLDLIRRWRYGGIRGSDVWSAEGRMVLFGVMPVFGLWLGLIILGPLVFDPLTVMVIDKGSPLIIFGGLILNMVLIKSRATESGNSLELVLPDTAWRFPDQSLRIFDLKVPPEGIEEICQFEDGWIGIHMRFLERYEWEDKKNHRVYVWQAANLKIPAGIADVFKRLGTGQIFHNNIFITLGSIDTMTVYVKEFVETDEGIEPVCLVAECAYTHSQFLQGESLPKSNDSLWYMAFKRAQKALGSEIKHNQYLEERLVVAEKEEPKHYKEAAENRMKAVRSRHARIMDTAEPLTSRLIRLIFNWKTILAIAVLIGVLWYIGVLRV